MSQVFQTMLLGRLVSRTGGKQIVFQGIATTPKEDLLVIKQLLEEGKLVPIIDNSYPLSKTVDAIRYLIEEHAQGKVVITLESNNKS